MQDGESATEVPAEEAWCQRLAAELARSAGLAEEPFGPDLRAALLRLARDVAHGTERRNAPLATFIAGRHVEARLRQGIEPGTALTEVSRAAAALLSDADGATPQPPPGG